MLSILRICVPEVISFFRFVGYLTLHCLKQGFYSFFAWVIIFAWGPLWEGRIWRRAVPSYGSRSKSWFIASALIFTMRSWRKFQIWRFCWMLLRTLWRATFGPWAAICPPLA